MDGKKLITSFFIANAVDATITSILLTQDGWRELNRFAAASMDQGGLSHVLILKLAFTAVLIGSYALAQCLDSRWAYPLEKALQVGGLVVWGVQVWNIANVLAAVVLRLA